MKIYSFVSPLIIKAWVAEMKELFVLISPVLWSFKNDITRFNRYFYRKAFFYAAVCGVFIVLLTKLLNVGIMKLPAHVP